MADDTGKEPGHYASDTHCYKCWYSRHQSFYLRFLIIAQAESSAITLMSLIAINVSCQSALFSLPLMAKDIGDKFDHYARDCPQG
jgi:hypothetical protein